MSKDNVDAVLANIGLRLQIARKISGYKTATSFCKAHHVNTASYTTYERGKRSMRLEPLINYCATLGLSFAWLMSGQGQPFVDNEKSEHAIQLLKQTKTDMKKQMQWLYEE